METAKSSRVAFITGAASGIGYAYATCLLMNGWSVALFDLHDFEETLRILDDAGHSGGRVFVHYCDVGDSVSFRAAFDAGIARFGGVDLFVNNAGILRFMFADASNVINVNLMGTIRGTEMAVKHATEGLTIRSSRPNGLLVVSTASTNGLVPADCDMAPSYVASKFGIVGLTRSLKFLHSRFNVRVNCICPVTVETSMVNGLITPEVAAFLDKENRGGVMSPQLCVDALLKLIEDDTIAGEVVTVHPSNPKGGKIEPLDSFGQFSYLGGWREDGNPDVAAFVDGGVADIASGAANAWSGI